MKFSGAMVTVMVLAVGMVIAAPVNAEGKPTRGKEPPPSEVLELVKALASSDSREVSQALDSLGKLGPKAAPAAPALRKLLDHKSLAPEAVITLGAIGPEAKDAAGDIKQRMPKWKEKHRIQAHGALYFMGDAPEERLKAIAEAIRSDDPGVRDAAVSLVARIGPPAAKAVPALVQLLVDKEGSTEHTARALGAIGRKALPAVRVFRGYLTGSDSGLRKIAIATIGDIGVADMLTVKTLLALVRKKHFDDCYPAARCLGLLGRSSMNAVRLLVTDKDRVMRGYAVVAMKHAGANGVPYLIKLLADKHVGSSAGMALSEMKPPPVLELIGALKSRRPGVSMLALNALGKIKPACPAAINAIMRRYDAGVRKPGDHDRMTEKCTYALWQMGGLSRAAGCYMRLFRWNGPMEKSQVASTSHPTGGRVAMRARNLIKSGPPKRYAELAALVAMTKDKQFWMTLRGGADNTLSSNYSWFDGFKESKNTDRETHKVGKWMSCDWLAFGIDSRDRIHVVRIDVPAFNEWRRVIQNTPPPAAVGVSTEPAATTKPAGRKPTAKQSAAAARRVRTARAYITSGMHERAKAILQKVIKDAADPAVVAKAKKMLAEIP